MGCRRERPANSPARGLSMISTMCPESQAAAISGLTTHMRAEIFRKEVTVRRMYLPLISTGTSWHI